jgi:hypothetical protein
LRYNLLALVGTTSISIANIIAAHCSNDLIGKDSIEKITLLITDKNETIIDQISTSLNHIISELEFKLPPIEHLIIDGEDLHQIIYDMKSILNKIDEPCILDITGGRKIMSVGATLAWLEEKQKEWLISYYLLKHGGNEYHSRYLHQLLDDEWDLFYWSDIRD